MKPWFCAVWLCLLISILTWQADAQLFSRAAQGPLPPPKINSVALSGIGAFIPGVAGTVGSGFVMTSGSVGTISWSLRTSGTDHAGRTCQNTGSGFSANNSTGSVTNNANPGSGTYTPCLVATASNPGTVNSPYVQQITIIGGTIASIALSNNSFTSGSSIGTVIGNLSAKMSPSTLSFGGAYSFSTSTPNCNSTNGAQNGDFEISGSSLEVAVAGLTAGNYAACVVASQGSLASGVRFTLSAAKSGGIACAIGPNYTGTIPPDAQAAGFTTCVLNVDFSSSDFTNTATWLNCRGQSPSKPIWWLQAYSAGPNPPCSDAKMVSDGPYSQVLDLKYSLQDARNGTYSSVMHSSNNGPGTYFPLGKYVEYRMRLSVATENYCDYIQGGRTTCEYFSFFEFGSGSSPFLELDYLEMYNFTNCSPTYACDGGGGEHYVNSSSGGVWSVANLGGQSYNPTAYFTHANLYTTDGSSRIALCMYFNGTKYTCGTSTFSPSSVANQHHDIQFNVGTNNNGPQNDLPNSDRDAYIHHILVLSCAKWKTQPCSGTLVHQ